MGEFRFYAGVLLEHREVVECFTRMFPDAPGHFLVSDNDVARREHLGNVATQLELTDDQMLAMVAYDSSGASLRTDPMVYIDPEAMGVRQHDNPAGIVFAPDKPLLFTDLCNINDWRQRSLQLQAEFELKVRVNLERLALHRDRFLPLPDRSLYFLPVHGWRIDERIAWYEAMLPVIDGIVGGIAVPGSPHSQVVPVESAVDGNAMLLQRQLEYLAQSTLLPHFLGHERVHVFGQLGTRVLPLLVYLSVHVYEQVSSDSTTITSHDAPNRMYWHPAGRYGHKRISLGQKAVEDERFVPLSDDYPACHCEFCALTFGETKHLDCIPNESRLWLSRRFQRNVYDLAAANAGNSSADPEFIRLLTAHNLTMVRREIAMLSDLARDKRAFRKFLTDHELEATRNAVELIDTIVDEDADLGAFLARVREWEAAVGIAAGTTVGRQDGCAGDAVSPSPA